MVMNTTRNEQRGTRNVEEREQPACSSFIVHRSSLDTKTDRRRRMQKGFTLIELLVVVTIVGILAAVAVVNVKYAQRKAREAAMMDDLMKMREAIDNFYADKQRYPNDLNELVPQYLKKIPKDPITGAADWEPVMDTPDPTAPAMTDPSGNPLQPGVVDVKSTAPGTTLDNVPYTEL
jgi:general secretion pathway protein G